MIYDFRYILKRVIIGLAIALGVMYLKSTMLTAHALSYQTDTLILDNAYIYQEYWYERAVDTGFNMKLIGVADTDINTNLYGQILMCAGPSNNSVIWVPGDQPNSWGGTARNVSVNNTNIPCKVGTTSGKVQQVMFITRTVDGDFTATVRMSYKDGYTGFAFISYGVSEKPWDYIQSSADVYNNILNSIDSRITSLQSSIIQSNNDQNAFIKKVEDAVKAMHETMGSDDIDTNEQDSKINAIKNSGYNNNSISDIILLPVNLLSKLVDGLGSNSCSSYNLGNLYGTDLVFTCISSSDMQSWLGSTLYGLIDILMSFCVILGIRKFVIKIYNTIIFLREGGNTVD